jgi:hypothetical protein
MNGQPRPGPWEAQIDDCPEFANIEITDSDMQVIAVVRNANDMEDDPREWNENEIEAESQSTAKVMAASLELAFALEVMVDYHGATDADAFWRKYGEALKGKIPSQIAQEALEKAGIRPPKSKPAIVAQN